VSGAIRSLEDRVGTPLLVRGRRSVRLTAAGAALLPQAERALLLAAEAEAAVDRAVAGERLRLSVAAGEALATYQLPGAIAALRRRLPSLDVSFVVGDTARVLSALRSGEVDAALITGHTAPADIETAVYGRERTVLIAAPGEPPPERPLRLADLAGRVLVQRDTGTINRREVDRVLRDADVEPAGRLEASSLEAVKRCVESSLGVALVPASAVARELELGLLRELPMRRPVLEFDLCLAWRRGELPGRPVSALLEVLAAGDPAAPDVQ
jgi:DNA-binding transcriptional LysR family regulator